MKSFKTFTVNILVTSVVIYLQFVFYIGFKFVVAFVLVSQSFTCFGFNFVVRKFILQDGSWTRVSIRHEPFIGIHAIRALPVHATFKLHR